MAVRVTDRHAPGQSPYRRGGGVVASRAGFRRVPVTPPPSPPTTTKIVQEVFSYSSKDAEEATLVLSDEVIIDMAEQIGKQDGEIKELKKELRTKRPR